MAKISDSLRAGKLKHRWPAAVPASGTADFGKLVEQQQMETSSIEASSPYPQQLLRLFADTERDADALRQGFSRQRLAQYRRSLMALMKVCVEQGFGVEHQNGRLNLLNRSRKRYAILRLLEQQCHDLAAAALDQQADEIVLLEKINQIQGLLVNLLS